MIRTPRQPSEQGPQFEYARRMAAHARQHQNAGAYSLQGDLTTHGYIPRPSKGGPALGDEVSATPRPIGMVFRGEWAPDLDYEMQDVVVIYGIRNSGLYCAIAPAPAGSPEPGTQANPYWIKIAPGFTPAVWG